MALERLLEFPRDDPKKGNSPSWAKLGSHANFDPTGNTIKGNVTSPDIHIDASRSASVNGSFGNTEGNTRVHLDLPEGDPGTPPACDSGCPLMLTGRWNVLHPISEEMQLGRPDAGAGGGHASLAGM